MTYEDCNDCGLRIEMPDGSLSDACTNFPNGPWLDCCYYHDLAYRQAQPKGWWARWRARRSADVVLFWCVWKTGNRLVAIAILLGVRMFGWWAWRLHRKRNTTKGEIQ